MQTSLFAQTVSVEKILNPDGTLISGMNGSYTTVGYNLEYREDGAPKLVKIAELDQTNAAVSWSSFGRAKNGANNKVSAIAVSGSDIYIGGDFTAVNDIPANHIARWNGSTWSALGTNSKNGVNGAVFTLAVCGTEVYVGGNFNTLGDSVTSAKMIAKWSVTTNTWSALPCGTSNGVNNYVYTLAVSGTDIYLGGAFSTLGDNITSAKHIVKWSTTANTWSILPCGTSNGVSSSVFILSVLGTDIFLGGGFTLLGDSATSANMIAKWSTTTNTWSILPCGASNGVNSAVWALAACGSDIYVGGRFTSLGDGTTTVNYIAKWNTTTNTWSSLACGTSNGVNSFVDDLVVSGTDVYVGGRFRLLGDGVTSANYVAKWNSISNTWSTLPISASNGVNSFVYALAVDGSDVYLGGIFTKLADGTNALSIAKWNMMSLTWATLPNDVAGGTNNTINAVAVSGTDIYIGGNFTVLNDGPTSANYIAKWSTTTNSWSTLASGSSNGVNGSVNAIAVYGTDIFVGGDFTFLGNGITSAKYIAKWSTKTNTWSTLPSGFSNGVNNPVYALAISGTNLYVGGDFTLLSDGTPANHIAKWQIGSNVWTTLPSVAWNGVNDAVFALAVSGSDIYAGGQFTLLGDASTSANHIARWNSLSNTWSTLTTGTSNGVSAAVFAITVYGTDIYVGGNFRTLGSGLNYGHYIVKWNTVYNTWFTLPCGTSDGVGAAVRSIAVSQSDVYIGGAFTSLGDGIIPANYIAKWNRNTSAWSSLSEGIYNGTNGNVRVLNIDKARGRMVVGGDFLNAGSKLVNYIASFVDPENILPVELLSFTAQFEETSIRLIWKTATEKNNKEFIVERKFNSDGFYAIARIPGNGTTTYPVEYEYIDSNPAQGKYRYRLKQIDFDGTVSLSQEIEIDFAGANSFELYQNYPNPFNPTTTISYQILRNGFVSLIVYDALGRKVQTLVNEEKARGKYSFVFDASSLPSGVYFYTLRAGEFISTKKLMLIK